MKKVLGLAVLATSLAAAGCANTNDNIHTANANTTNANTAGSAANTAAREVGEAANTTGAAVGDAAITGKIKAKFLADGIVGTNVDTVNGEVTLKGTVETAQEKTKAEKIAKETEGVKSVKNELTVEKK